MTSTLHFLVMPLSRSDVYRWVFIEMVWKFIFVLCLFCGRRSRKYVFMRQNRKCVFMRQSRMNISTAAVKMHTKIRFDTILSLAPFFLSFLQSFLIFSHFLVWSLKNKVDEFYFLFLIRVHIYNYVIILLKMSLAKICTVMTEISSRIRSGPAGSSRMIC